VFDTWIQALSLRWKHFWLVIPLDVKSTPRPYPSPPSQPQVPCHAPTTRAGGVLPCTCIPSRRLAPPLQPEPTVPFPVPASCAGDLRLTCAPCAPPLKLKPVAPCPVPASSCVGGACPPLHPADPAANRTASPRRSSASRTPSRLARDPAKKPGELSQDWGCGMRWPVPSP
jgi:hypothetical protein